MLHAEPGAPAGTLVAVLAKQPQLGQVKTRLAKTTGDELALRHYGELLRVHIQNVDLFAAGTTVSLQRSARLYWDRLPAAEQFRPSIARSTVWLEDAQQAGGSIGDRMRIIYEDFIRQRRYARLLITGSDCPYLTAARLSAVETALTDVSCAIIPAFDGGYVLLGLTRAFDRTGSDLFSAMPWSCPDLLDSTVARLMAAQVDFQLLEPLEDVDEQPALERWLGEPSKDRSA